MNCLFSFLAIAIFLIPHVVLLLIDMSRRNLIILSAILALIIAAILIYFLIIRKTTTTAQAIGACTLNTVLPEPTLTYVKTDIATLTPINTITYLNTVVPEPTITYVKTDIATLTPINTIAYLNTVTAVSPVLTNIPSITYVPSQTYSQTYVCPANVSGGSGGSSGGTGGSSGGSGGSSGGTGGSSGGTGGSTLPTSGSGTYTVTNTCSSAYIEFVIVYNQPVNGITSSTYSLSSGYSYSVSINWSNVASAYFLTMGGQQIPANISGNTITPASCP